MKWINFKNGIKARINEMLGTSDNAGTGNNLTTWSLQSAMLTNLRRIVSGIVGDASYGRVMKGLRVQEEFTNGINILPGFGFTNNGDIVYLETSVNATINWGLGDPLYLILKYENVEVEDTDKGGKQVNIIGGTSEWIVNDDRAYAEGGDTIVEVVATLPSNNDFILVATIASDSGSPPGIDTITESVNRGLAPNRYDDQFDVPNIDVKSDGIVRGILYATAIQEVDGGTISVDSPFNFTENVAFEKDVSMLSADEVVLPSTAGTLKVGATSANDFTITSADVVSLTIKNGIVTAASPS